jgi:hypothetical protein
MGSESARRQPGPTVVFAESNIAGSQNLARFAEVRLPESDPSAGAPLVAVAAHSVLFGNELNAGLVLPLSGAYLAPDVDGTITEDVATTVLALTSADGVTAETRAERIGAGVFRIGVAPDRTLAPNDQVPDRDAVLLLDGPEGHDEIVVVPALPEAPLAADRRPGCARGLSGPGRATRHRDGATRRGAAARIECRPAHACAARQRTPLPRSPHHVQPGRPPGHRSANRPGRSVVGDDPASGAGLTR